MTGPSLAQRYWRSLTGAGRGADVVRVRERARDGYTFWQRYWASLTMTDLPPRAAPEAAAARTVVPPLPRYQVRAGQGTWRALPRVPSLAGLQAGGDDVLSAAVAPDGAEFYVRRGGTSRYRVEIVVRGGGEMLPAMMKVRYPTPDGQRTLLVPLVADPLGIAVSQVELPGLESDTDWYASAPVPVLEAADWDADLVADSVRFAASEATRTGWRVVGDITAHAALRAAITRSLR